MAVPSLCGKLLGGQDIACAAPVRKYYQQAVVINRSDIDFENSVVTKPDPTADPATCDYSVQMVLKEGAVGYRFTGPEKGSSYYVTYDKSRSDLGITQYIHNGNILIVGASEEDKCKIDALDKGNFVVAFQLMDGTVEIIGWEYGVGTGDYTGDLQTNGGATSIILSSDENAPESMLPLVYVSETPGQENEDFDDAFENPTP